MSKTSVLGLRRRFVVLSAMIVALAAVGSAQAYWLSNGWGSGISQVGSLDAPTLSASPGTGTVALSWTAVTPPETGPVTYYVSRDGGDVDGNCPTSSAPASVLSCTDAGLAAGTYNYTVTAVWRTWTATSSPATSVTLTFGGIHHFLLAVTTTNPNAGAADNLTITAKDSNNNTVSTFAGSHNVTFAGASAIGSYNPTVSNSGGTAVNFGSATAIGFTNGVATVSGASNGVMRLYRAETANITVSEGGSYTSNAVAVTVSPLGISTLSLAAASSTPSAGAADDLTITAHDTYGNTATAYTGSHNVTFAGASAIGSYNPTVSNSGGTAVNFGSATAIGFTNGVATVSGASNGVMRLYRAETANITVSEGGSYTSNAVAVTVSSGAPISFTVPNPGTRTAGTAFNLTLTASNDAYGNAPTSYAGTQCLTFSGPAASPNGTAPLYPVQGSCAAGQSAVTFNAAGSATVNITLYDATASTTLTATDAVYGTTGTSGAFAVDGLASMGSFVLTAATTTPIAGQADNVTITAGDVYGNLLTSYTGNHNLTFTGASPITTYQPTVTNRFGTAIAFGTAESITFTNGTATAVMRLYRAQTAHVVVSDGTFDNGSGLQVTVGAAAMDGLSLAAEKAVVRPGAADNLTVRATDPYGNTAPDYPDGSHSVTFSGASMSGSTHPTVTNNSGTPINFGNAVTLDFTNGVASVSGSSNGLMRLYAVERANITVSDGTHTSDVLSIVVNNVTATAVAAGGFHNCALVDGGVQCWGYNNQGQLGNGSTTNSSTPVRVVGVGGVGYLAGVSQISASKYHTCALVSGSVYCWGQNDYGQLGNNSTTDSSRPVQVRVSTNAYLTNVTQISAGGGHTCAVRSDTSVWCWGYNAFGQVGDNTTTTPRRMAVQVHINNSNTHLSGAVEVAAGHNHSCARLSDGTVRCWGYNAYGEVGDGTTTNRDTAILVVGPGGTGTLSGVVSIGNGSGSGRFHSCARLSDGSIYCWGDNEHGELGDGTTTNRSYPVRAGDISTAISISAGEYHSCATLEDGTAMCWGAAAFGQVGDGTTANTSTPVPVIGPGGFGLLTGVATVSAGGGNWPDGSGTDNYEHTIALLSDGTVVSWGQNNFGQLGDGTTTMSISPVAVALL